MENPLPPLDAEEVHRRAQAWVDAGDYRQAIDFAMEQNRRLHDFSLEAKLLQWRRQAFDGRSRARPDWPPKFSDLLAGYGRPPEIGPDQLNPETLAAGILGHGSLLVRGLLEPGQAERLVEGIDLAFEHCSRHIEDYDDNASSRWYKRFPFPADHFISQTRPWVESAAGVLLADSPRMAYEFMQLLGDLNVLESIQGYLGEPPTLSIAKTTLRRVPSTLRLTGWHQDGAFLGSGIRSVNLWLSLSHCGQDASGLDLLPRRLDYLVETGTHGAIFDWSVGESLVTQLCEHAPLASPVFRPGDALLFDERLLHRTGLPPGMKHNRYAIESWFFAPSSYPMKQEPLVV